MELPTDFKNFLKEIRPTERQRSDAKTGHETLRDRLRNDEGLKAIYISDFLQGSYRRATAVRPKGEERFDVDIVVVTELDEEDYTPQEAMDKFKPFLDAHYKDKWHAKGRAFGIELSYVEMDLVITSAPSEELRNILGSDAVTEVADLVEAKDWRLNSSWVALSKRWQPRANTLMRKALSEAEWDKLEPLRIPDREAEEWAWTHPLEQIRWTRDKNASTNSHYVNVVKALKWWRLENYATPEHPKSYPLERLVGEQCPDDIGSVAQGITETLEGIVESYTRDEKPTLWDLGLQKHGIDLDVFARVTDDDFAQFYDQVEEGADLARRALDCQDRNESRKLWRELLGSNFPEPEDGNKGDSGGGYSARTGVTIPGSGRFA